ncbi:hypothetical protein VIN7_7732 [Saccharomyces cerevisiae x Saccharomyces kudriavzevii VIN7]|uniref:Secreted protein n=1 Tax=Saccharomyces cerevisiae x Saccharomyces kudriavzevii (strain VIN7) TaxID=1095631 RepID=H0GW83_SACCK|nr:hypothetical protein VIN7_7732 [Saccharomyces cerevisiae x Saccharomyces kudriavzevii VIN7]
MQIPVPRRKCREICYITLLVLLSCCFVSAAVELCHSANYYPWQHHFLCNETDKPSRAKKRKNENKNRKRKAGKRGAGGTLSPCLPPLIGDSSPAGHKKHIVRRCCMGVGSARRLSPPPLPPPLILFYASSSRRSAPSHWASNRAGQRQLGLLCILPHPSLLSLSPSPLFFPMLCARRVSILRVYTYVVIPIYIYI